MPLQLLTLKEQLANLKIVYDAALTINTLSRDQIEKLKQQMLELEAQINERQKLLSEK